MKEALEGYNDNAQVYYVKDWETCDEYGILTELAPLQGVTDQKVVIDTGFDFEDQTEVLLEFYE